MLEINEREVAVYALMDITDGGGYNNIVLNNTLLRYRGADSRSRSLVTEMVNGTLRNLIFIDYIISLYSNTPLNKIKPYLRGLLRLSVYQLVFMDRIPPSAACNEAVKLTKKRGYAGLAGFVNGLLRNISANVGNFDLPDIEKDPVKHISVIYSFPEWIIDYWRESMPTNRIIDICKASNLTPDVSLCVNTLRISPEELSKLFKSAGLNAGKGNINKDALRFTGGTDGLFTGESFKKGLFHVMDEGAMEVVRIAGLEPDMQVLDLCAAPGGKTFYAAYIMGDTGVICAADKYGHKIDLVNDGILRLGLNSIKTEINDATLYNGAFDSRFDAVFLDAPCSGLGVLAKKPDAKHRKSFEDVRNMSRLQRDMLIKSAAYPKIGGKLVYSTCTVSQLEDEDNIEWFLNEFPYEKVDGFTLMPDKYGTDGFFAAVLRRKI